MSAPCAVMEWVIVRLQCVLEWVGERNVLNLHYLFAEERLRVQLLS